VTLFTGASRAGLISLRIATRLAAGPRPAREAASLSRANDTLWRKAENRPKEP
jgi:hypothetical protein